MAPRGIKTGLVIFVVAILYAKTIMGQSNCNSVLMSMASCLNYVTGSAATPPASCCTALANVVQTQPRCLCAIVNGGSSLGMSINQTRALDMPSVCNIETPPPSRCNAANGPAMSPMGSPEGSPAGSPTPSIDSSVTAGSKTTPGAASNGSITKTNLHLVATLVLIVASLVSTFSNF